MTLKILNYKKVPDSNNSPPPVGAPENNDPSTVNNIQREMMAALAEYTEQMLPRKTTVGTNAVYALTIGPTGLAPQQDYIYLCKFHLENADNPTLNINSAGPKALKGLNGDPLIAGAIEKGAAHALWYDGTEFRTLTLNEYHEIRNGSQMLAIAADGSLQFKDGSDLRVRIDRLGNAVFDGEVTAQSTDVASDIRDKKNAYTLDVYESEILAKRVTPISYTSKVNNKEYYGFSAQNLQDIDNTLVGHYFNKSKNEDRLKINTTSLLAILWSAYQRLEARVRKLEA